jgi:uncharacterized membrane protein YeaQ/YmgE (transglycosylase-associated protein family)
MTFIIGFALWLAFGLIAAMIGRTAYPADTAFRAVTYIFGTLGAVIGGMLGMAPYVFNSPEPLRAGGIIGALLGAFLFVFMYHFTARRVT